MSRMCGYRAWCWHLRCCVIVGFLRSGTLGGRLMPDQPITVKDHVLIVDDDEDIRLTLAQVFANAGYATKSANNGAEAIELFEDGDHPRMVLVDLRMPGIIGHSVLEYMRSEPGLAQIPV